MGVVRQQFFIHEDIPFTSHNSSACAVVYVPDAYLIQKLTLDVARHLQKYSLEESDPPDLFRLDDLLR